MRILRQIPHALALLLVMVSLGAGGAAVADAGLAGNSPAAVPVPPWLLNCNLNPPYYHNNEVNVFHSSGATSYRVYRAT